MKQKNKNIYIRGETKKNKHNTENKNDYILDEIE